jgi:hypothetical protein
VSGGKEARQSVRRTAWLVNSLTWTMLVGASILALAIGGIKFLNLKSSGKFGFYVSQSDLIVSSGVSFFLCSITLIVLMKALLKQQQELVLSLGRFLVLVLGIGLIILPAHHKMHSPQAFVTMANKLMKASSNVYTNGYEWDVQFYSSRRLKVLPEFGPLEVGSFVLIDSGDLERIGARIGAEHLKIEAQSADGVRKPGHRLMLGKIIA